MYLLLHSVQLNIYGPNLKTKVLFWANDGDWSSHTIKNEGNKIPTSIKKKNLPQKEPCGRHRLLDTETPIPDPKPGRPHPSRPWSLRGQLLWAGSPPWQEKHPMWQRWHSWVQYWTVSLPWHWLQCKSRMDLPVLSQPQLGVSQVSRKTQRMPSDRQSHLDLPILNKHIKRYVRNKAVYTTYHSNFQVHFHTNIHTCS